MKGMLYKDFLLSRKNILYYVGFFLLYTFLAVVGAFPVSIISGVVVLVSISLPLSNFAWDNAAKWDGFAAAMPRGRQAVVGARYLFILLLTLFGTALAGVLVLILSQFGLVEEGLDELLLPIPICAAISLGFNAFSVPLSFRFGAEKSRIFGMIIFVAAFGGFVLAGSLYKNGGPALSEVAVAVGLLAASLLCVILFLVSWPISLAIYRKKEF